MAFCSMLQTRERQDPQVGCRQRMLIDADAGIYMPPYDTDYCFLCRRKCRLVEVALHHAILPEAGVEQG